jgi:hypothetical protein
MVERLVSNEGVNELAQPGSRLGEAPRNVEKHGCCPSGNRKANAL